MVTARHQSEQRRTGESDTLSFPGKLRIIGGRWRGRRLNVHEAEGLRPTPDRVRETLFNWLQPYLAGASCLDLFSGTGALCLEALSRGASHVVMVEQSARVAEQLRKHVATLEAEHATVIQMDAVVFLKQSAQVFDIIFLDPPFRSDLVERCAKLIEEQGWLRPNGLIYIEAPSKNFTLLLPPTWELIRHRVAGQVSYHLAKRSG